MYGQVALKMPRWIERLAVVLITAVLAVVTGAVLLQGEDAAALTPKAQSSEESQRGAFELVHARSREASRGIQVVAVEFDEVVSPKPTTNRIQGPKQADSHSVPGPADARATVRYSIRAGDRLEAIARKHYESPLAVRAILDANPGLDPMRLQIGQDITLPEWQQGARVTSAEGSADAPTGHRWLEIKPGDTLEGLARSHLGRRSDWPKLAALNADRLKDPHRLQVGQRLLVPLSAPNPSAKPRPSAAP